MIICRKRYERSQHVSGFLEFVVQLDNYSEMSELFLDVDVQVSSNFGQKWNHETKIPIENGRAQNLVLDTFSYPDGLVKIDIAIDEYLFTFSSTIANGDSDQAKHLRQIPNRLSKGNVFVGQCDSKLFAAISENRFKSDSFQIEACRKSRKRIDFEEEGFHIERNLIDPELVKRAKAEFSRIDEHELFGHRKGSSERMVNVHLKSEEIRQIYESQKIYDVVDELLGEKSFPAQSLAFIYGSQQSAHADWIHLSTFPFNGMCGVWIALEDVVEDSGELFYFPKSHKHHRISMDLLELNKVSSSSPDWTEFGHRYSREISRVLTNMAEAPIKFLPKAGDVLFWHENLIHGGSPILEKGLTRNSLVMHFFKNSCYAWYDSTGISGNKDMDLRLN